MTKSNDAQAPSSSPVITGPKKTRNYRTVTSIIILLIAVTCSFYAIYTSLRLQQGTTQQINTFLAQVNTLKQQQIDTDSQINSAIKIVSTSQEKLDALDKGLQSVIQQRLYQTKDWLLLKARYCLELAQINAHWSNNSDTTLALLQQADTLLADAQDQRAFVVRQAINKEIAMLQAIPKIDLTGLLSQLDAIQSIIATLELKPAITATEKNEASVNNESTSAWRERLKESVGLLEKLIVVRRHDEDILPLPSPAYETILRESIRLNLQEAQWAALQNNDAVYQFSLIQALKNINRAFEPHTAATETLIKQLSSLQQIHLIQQKPILEQSLPLLNQLIESKNTSMPTTPGDNS